MSFLSFLGQRKRRRSSDTESPRAIEDSSPKNMTSQKHLSDDILRELLYHSTIAARQNLCATNKRIQALCIAEARPILIKNIEHYERNFKPEHTSLYELEQRLLDYEASHLAFKDLPVARQKYICQYDVDEYNQMNPQTLHRIITGILSRKGLDVADQNNMLSMILRDVMADYDSIAMQQDPAHPIISVDYTRTISNIVWKCIASIVKEMQKKTKNNKNRPVNPYLYTAVYHHYEGWNKSNQILDELYNCLKKRFPHKYF